MVRQALAVRAAGARGAAEEQLGIARQTTDRANHVPGGRGAVVLPVLESWGSRRPGRTMGEFVGKPWNAIEIARSAEMATFGGVVSRKPLR